MEEYNEQVHGSYRNYQKQKIKNWNAKVEAKKKANRERRSKAKESAAKINADNEKVKSTVKGWIKEAKEEGDRENVKDLRKFKRFVRKSNTTTGKEVRKLQDKEAAFQHNTNMEKVKNNIKSIEENNPGWNYNWETESFEQDNVDSPVGIPIDDGVAPITQLRFKDKFKKYNPITQLKNK